MTDPKQTTEPAGQVVWCVICLVPGERGNEVAHIFSSPEKAQAFCVSDPRQHVIYDYVLDCPERMEGVCQ
jgi:hypothetical protein